VFRGGGEKTSSGILRLGSRYQKTPTTDYGGRREGGGKFLGDGQKKTSSVKRGDSGRAAPRTVLSKTIGGKADK